MEKVILKHYSIKEQWVFKGLSTHFILLKIEYCHQHREQGQQQVSPVRVLASMREVETQRLRRFYWCCQLISYGLGSEIVLRIWEFSSSSLFPSQLQFISLLLSTQQVKLGEKVLILITLGDLLSCHSPWSVSVFNYLNFMCIRGLENKRGIWKKLAEKKREAICLPWRDWW